MPIHVNTDGAAEPDGPAEKPARRRRAPLTPPAPPPMTVEQRNALATRLLTAAALVKILAGVTADGKAVMGKQIRTSENVIGSLDPDDDDPVEHGASLGTVSKARGAKRWTVTDREKFTAWVEELFPTEVVPTVRKSFEDMLIDTCKARDGFTHAVLGGELIIPPGVEFTVSDPQVRVNPSKEAEELVKAALANGGAARFLLDGPVPALEAGQ